MSDYYKKYIKYKTKYLMMKNSQKGGGLRSAYGWRSIRRTNREVGIYELFRDNEDEYVVQLMKYPNKLELTNYLLYKDDTPNGFGLDSRIFDHTQDPPQALGARSIQPRRGRTSPLHRETLVELLVDDETPHYPIQMLTDTNFFTQLVRDSVYVEETKEELDPTAETKEEVEIDSPVLAEAGVDFDLPTVLADKTLDEQVSKKIEEWKKQQLEKYTQTYLIPLSNMSDTDENDNLADLISGHYKKYATGNKSRYETLVTSRFYILSSLYTETNNPWQKTFLMMEIKNKKNDDALPSITDYNELKRIFIDTSREEFNRQLNKIINEMKIFHNELRTPISRHTILNTMLQSELNKALSYGHRDRNIFTDRSTTMDSPKSDYIPFPETETNGFKLLIVKG